MLCNSNRSHNVLDLMTMNATIRLNSDDYGNFVDFVQVRQMIVYLESNVVEDGKKNGDSIFTKFKNRLLTFKECK